MSNMFDGIVSGIKNATKKRVVSLSESAACYAEATGAALHRVRQSGDITQISTSKGTLEITQDRVKGETGVRIDASKYMYFISEGSFGQEGIWSGGLVTHHINGKLQATLPQMKEAEAMLLAAKACGLTPKAKSAAAR
ncbi:MAG: hypothetical protein HY053_08555 [Proteobacteria bacterium]|nr:hypothetical protein [Pseudomonadota bacterium]